MYKPGRPNIYFSIWNPHIHVLVRSFRFIWIPMLWVYVHYQYFNFFSAGSVLLSYWSHFLNEKTSGVKHILSSEWLAFTNIRVFCEHSFHINLSTFDIILLESDVIPNFLQICMHGDSFHWLFLRAFSVADPISGIIFHTKIRPSNTLTLFRKKTIFLPRSFPT